MNNPIVFMFSGQGSQYYQMGKDLFKTNAVFRKTMLEMDEIILKYIGKSIVNELYNPYKNISNKFYDILYTHPAIFMLEYSLYRVLIERGIVPDYLLGSSLGEFACAAISNIMPVKDVLECIVKQAIFIETYCSKGSMIAIVDDPNLFYRNLQLFENSELAAINYDSHFVISAANTKLNLITAFLNKQNIIYQLLPIAYGFHSSLIDPAQEAYREFLKTKTCQKTSIPFISCLSGNEVYEISNDFLWDAVRKPIQFQRAIQYLESQDECFYLDLGPSGTLANFLKHNLDEKSVQRCSSIITPFNQEIKNISRIEGMFLTK